MGGALSARVVMGHVVKGHVVPAVVMDARARAAAILEDARARAAATLEEARRRGLEEGRAEAAARLAGVLAAGQAEADAMLARVEPAALAIAARMAEKIVGRALDLDATLMADIAAEAVAACRTRAGLVQLRVHPEDLVAVAAAREALATRLGGEAALELVADESVGRYGCVVDTPVGRVDARLATQLAAFERVLAADDEDGATAIREAPSRG
jgi:flagellar biosynthesis/type III secretory pathway protein FliH